MSAPSSRLRWITMPFSDTMRGADACLVFGLKGLFRMMLGLVIGWWVYVPVHELFHAWGCLVTGGAVDELMIQAKYGGALLARVIPYVQAGGEYAGQLTDFDTGGNDLIYLATVAAPFLLTLFPGVWLLRRAAIAKMGFWFGFSMPLALAPILSVTGDAYEIGSILVTQVRPWSATGRSSVLRGDDLILMIEKMSGSDVTNWLGLVLATLLGLVFCFVAYGLGSGVARVLGRGALAR